MKSKLNIALVLSNAPLAYPIPPLNQGGTEKAMYDLAEELVRKGHQVTVFAAKGSTGSANIIEYPSSVTEEKIGSYVARKLPPGVDIINDFTFSSSVKRRKLPIPTVSTHQCPIGLFTSKSIYPSRKMLAQVGKKKGYTVYNGIDPGEIAFSDRKQDYLLFIGRVIREKGVMEAIQVAESTGHRLMIAGPIKDDKLYREEIEPKLRQNPRIQYVGAVSGKEKLDLFQNAKCMLFPILWEEPFGLVMIEAMAAGTPVLAFNRGSVGEVMACFPQLICHSVKEMATKVGRADFPSPQELRQYVEKHYSREAMATGYLRIYRKLIGRSGRRRPKAGD
ncbi:MAG: glycosyl transferase [Paenibacillaceae bacterium]|nr:glycosyl transferase [Paenibacillaceae bacterium]